MSAERIFELARAHRCIKDAEPRFSMAKPASATPSASDVVSPLVMIPRSIPANVS